MLAITKIICDRIRPLAAFGAAIARIALQPQKAASRDFRRGLLSRRCTR
jgi:hypothetical protein